MAFIPIFYSKFVAFYQLFSYNNRWLIVNYTPVRLQFARDSRKDI